MSYTKKNTVTKGWKVKRVLLFGIFPLLMLPFIFIYVLSAWWLLTVLDGFPGGFFKQHPNLTAAGLVILACFLLFATGQTLWETMRARFS